MAKKNKYYVLTAPRQQTNDYTIQEVGIQKGKMVSKNLFRLSAVSQSWDSELIENSMTKPTNPEFSSAFGASSYLLGKINNYFYSKDLAGQNEYVAFFDRSYIERRSALRAFAKDAMIETCTEIIADETIVYDDSGFFAYPNTEALASKLKAGEKADDVIRDMNESFREIYFLFNFHEGHDAWEYCKKLLVDGVIAFEIIFSYDDNGTATSIAGFKELDPAYLKPEFIDDPNLGKVKVWKQITPNDTDYSTKDNYIPDSNIIYITWSNGDESNRVSYVERLIRPFNILKQLENSRIIWNIQNSQRRMRVDIPVSTQNEQRIKSTLSEFAGMYREELLIDQQSGEVTYNGSPNFNFAKTFLMPSNPQGKMEISEIANEGYDMNSTDQLNYFHERFISESCIPRGRLINMANKNGSNPYMGESMVTREEYTFSRFINRYRNVFKEILIKPMWIQFSLKHPEYAMNTVLKRSISIEFIRENLFTIYKEREIAQSGATTISQLASMVNPATQKPIFSFKFLMEKYMGLSDADMEKNRLYLEKEEKESQEQQSSDAEQNPFSGDMSDMSFPSAMGDTLGGLDLPQGGESASDSSFDQPVQTNNTPIEDLPPL